MPGKSTDRTPTASEFRAIDAIYAAYMACNAAERAPGWDSGLCYSYSTAPGVMGALEDAGRMAWRMLGFTPRAAREIWWGMCDGGSGAEWHLAEWRRNGPYPQAY